MAASSAYDGFQVARWVDAFGGFVSRRPRLWIALGNIETRVLEDEISATAVERPIFISGLARAGSTILLEILAGHDDVVSHRYQDYPLLFTPYWWNRLIERMPTREVPPAERTHRDGITVGPTSPEAFEEVLWMAFFPHLHQASQSDVLDEQTAHPQFEAFYREHIRKLLRVRGGRRYLSKGNYNVTRLEYLLKLFPDARFVVPVRDPVWHIASLMKQHALFCEGCSRHPEAVKHLRRVGHFEFGLTDARSMRVIPRSCPAWPAPGATATSCRAGRYTGRKSTAIWPIVWTPIRRCGTPRWSCASRTCAALRTRRSSGS